MRPAVAAALILFSVCSGTDPLFAKGATSKVVITGGDLRAAVEITDPQLLKNFHVWAGPGTFTNGVEGMEGFIVNWAAGAVPERPACLPRYELVFYARNEGRNSSKPTDRLVYAVTYEADPVTGDGYVYLPGRDDERYRLNTQSIHRRVEGKWFRAAAEWQTVFRRVIPL